MVVKVRISSSNITDPSNFDMATSYATIKQLGSSAETLQSVDYSYAVKTTAQSIAAMGGDVLWDSRTGNVAASGTSGFALKAGKTYDLDAGVYIYDGNGQYARWAWADTAGNKLTGTSEGASTEMGAAAGNSAYLPAGGIYTPSTDQVVKVHFTAYSSGSSNVQPGNSYGYGQTYARVVQLGTSAFTGLTLNGLQAANATGAIDNLTNVQTWNWSTLTTGTAMTFNTSALTSGTALGLINTGTTATGPMAIIQTGSNSGAETGTHITFKRPDGTVIGTIAQNAAGTVAYNTSSDQRLKENITDTSYGVLDLMKINVRDFNYKNDPTGRKMNGFIAQELYKIYPDAVTVGTDEVDDKGNLTNPWSVDYGRLTPLLIKSVQDISNKQDKMAAEIDSQIKTVSKAGAIDGANTYVTGLSVEFGDAKTLADVLNYLDDKVNQLDSRVATLESQNPTINNNTTDVINRTEQVTNNVTQIIKDTAQYGSTKILKGKIGVKVHFATAFKAAPAVYVTPLNGKEYEIQDVTVSGFTIMLTTSSTVDAKFNWMAAEIAQNGDTNSTDQIDAVTPAAASPSAPAARTSNAAASD